MTEPKHIEEVPQFQGMYKQIMELHKENTPYLQACCIILGAWQLIHQMEKEELDSEEDHEQISILKQLSELREPLLGIYQEYFID